MTLVEPLLLMLVGTHAMLLAFQVPPGLGANLSRPLIKATRAGLVMWVCGGVWLAALLAGRAFDALHATISAVFG